MDMLIVEGARRLSGRVRVHGSKNATLPIMAASLAVDGPVTLNNVPALVDVVTMARLLRSLGARVSGTEDRVEIDAQCAEGVVAEYDLVRQMRAGVCVLGPLLARFGSARVSLPGGCNIGHRPIDLHLRGLTALGADIRINGGYVVAESGTLRGTELHLDGPHGSSVTATCNVMTAATLARGRTIIHCAAMEPEVAGLAAFLNRLGAKIEGAGTSTIEITGVEHLHGGSQTIVSDRIEAATLAIAAAITRSDIEIEEAPVDHLASVISKLREIGVNMAVNGKCLKVNATGTLRSSDITARPYPGIPTDTQAQFMALLATIPGNSLVTDSVFPDRFMHASELLRMGARLRRAGDSTLVQGVNSLSGAPLMACDLRASAALLLAAMAADGESRIRRIYHLDRGYVQLEQKLNQIGARIRRCDETRTQNSRVS
ncbi:MAG: UDP-N-acetylglucosamine 1-carboxyvinyltransferase [Fuerstiella sp.]|nr:UDP-N-acetylglucosamine 1-carboxyvinyltransferase [Fuerstiella sp.]